MQSSNNKVKLIALCYQQLAFFLRILPLHPNTSNQNPLFQHRLLLSVFQLDWNSEIIEMIKTVEVYLTIIFSENPSLHLFNIFTCRTSFALSVFFVLLEGVSIAFASAIPFPCLSFKRSIGSYVPVIPIERKYKLICFPLI